MGMSVDSDGEDLPTVGGGHGISGSVPPQMGNLNTGPGSLVSTETVLATAGYDHTVKLWNISTALCVKTFQHPDSVKKKGSCFKL